VSIHDKAVLLRCTVYKWDGAIRDVSASRQFMAAHNMDKDSGVFNKYLIAKSALKPIEQAVSQVRRFHQSMTIPWSLDGVGLITNVRLLDYTRGMREHRDAFNVAVNNFLLHYDVHISNARKRLGDRFDLSEFPTVTTLRCKFGVEVQPLPVPSSNHILVDLASAGIDKSEIDREVERATNKAMERMWASIYTRLDQIREVLDDPEHRVHKSHFDALADFMDKLEDFNLFDSHQFKTFASFIRIRILGVPLDQIKHDPLVRKDVADKVREAMAAAEQFTGEEDGITQTQNQ
jgi:hypothetical protein